MDMIPFVDENDIVLGHKNKADILPTDITRASGLWMTNARGEILLARRAYTKKNHPGCWGPAVAGTVEQDEEYETNILKEAEEELGLKNITPRAVKKIFMSGSTGPHFTQWYRCETTLELCDLTLQTEEVAEVRWFTEDEFRDTLQDSPHEFVGNIQEWIGLFL